MTNSGLTGLYAITSARQLHSDFSLLSSTQAAFEGGVQILQYRAKDQDASRALRQARLLARLCREYHVIFLINDDPYLAKACDAHGVHLGQQDCSITQARQLLGPHAIIGQTCHASLDLAQRALDQGADYLAFGRCFPSQTKPEAPPASLDIFQQAARFGLPMVGIGGITPATAGEVVRAGAQMIAVCDSLFNTAQPQQVAQQYQHALQEANSFPFNEVQHDSLSRTF
ncbi:thiamine phosphate synthase [Marinospirillum sp. MEB164]|uniref:Thiamine-phosphate synthase n=1 Tax=Marinospirillum alkalitolerans TaxID=3123374 RepID=A0ABW8Q0R8_9GAMM